MLGNRDESTALFGWFLVVGIDWDASSFFGWFQLFCNYAII